MFHLGSTVGLLGTKELQHLRPQVGISAPTRISQADARLDQAGMVLFSHVHLPKYMPPHSGT
jgi:hypothetical protein